MAVLDATRKTQAITRNQMRGILALQKGATMVSLITHTDPATRKGDKGICVKQSHTNGVINWHYEGAVNRQQLREGGEGNFEVKPRKWGTRIPNTPLVEHKGNYYVELKVERALQTDYFLRQPDGSLVGVGREEIAHLLPKRKSSAPSQGVKREVVLRDYKLASIEVLRMGGVEYHLTD